MNQKIRGCLIKRTAEPDKYVGCIGYMRVPDSLVEKGYPRHAFLFIYVVKGTRVTFEDIEGDDICEQLREMQANGWENPHFTFFEYVLGKRDFADSPW